MELRQFEAFAAVARSGGFSTAAREIGSTQSTVSKAILQLEHDCGEQLLERLPQGAVLTDAGRVVFDHIRVILTERENIVSELKSLRGLESGRLRIGMPLMGSDTIFAPVFAEFLKRYPAIRIEMQEHGGQRLEAAVQSGEIEIAASLLPAPANFSFHQICDEPMMAVLSAQHPQAGHDRLRLSDLTDIPCILFAQGFALNSVITSAYAHRDIPLVEAARSSQPEFVLALASAGLGVAYLPRFMVAARPDFKAAVVDEPDFRWRLGLIWRSNSQLSPAGKRFLELAKSMLPAYEEHLRD